MKRKIAFALLSISSMAGAWSCLTWAQDPVGPARSPQSKVTTTRSSGGGSFGGDIGLGETISIAGAEGTNGWASTFNRNSQQDENVAKLVKSLKSSEGADKEAVLTQLKSAVGSQFDMRQEGKANELKALEEQLAKLKEIHAKRTQQRDQIVAERVQQILREAEGLGWGSDSNDATSLMRFPASRAILNGATATRFQGDGSSPAFAPAVITPLSK